MLELVKEKGLYPHKFDLNRWTVLKIFLIKNYLRDVNISLKDEWISEKDYLHVIDVWIMFKMNTMGDYHNLYLKTDILLLADVFETFVGCLYYYGLDLCHYFSSPQLSWDGMLKMIEVELERISDIDMYLLFKWEEVFLTLL